LTLTTHDRQTAGFSVRGVFRRYGTQTDRRMPDRCILVLC